MFQHGTGSEEDAPWLEDFTSSETDWHSGRRMASPDQLSVSQLQWHWAWPVFPWATRHGHRFWCLPYWQQCGIWLVCRWVHPGAAQGEYLDASSPKTFPRHVRSFPCSPCVTEGFQFLLMSFSSTIHNHFIALLWMGHRKSDSGARRPRGLVLECFMQPTYKWLHEVSAPDNSSEVVAGHQYTCKFVDC